MKRKPGRPRKYKTKEERIEATRKYRREYMQKWRAGEVGGEFNPNKLQNFKESPPKEE